MVIALGILLPVAFVAGIAARKTVPVMASLPGELTVAPQKFAVSEWQRDDLFPKTPIQVRLLRESAGSGRFAVAFSAPKDFVKPDVIVYWASGNPALTDELPEDAVLLGAFNPSVPLPFPPNVASGGGVLVLYSLADQDIIEVSKPFTLQ
jgi:hypothetical protein